MSLHEAIRQMKKCKSLQSFAANKWHYYVPNLCIQAINLNGWLTGTDWKAADRWRLSCPNMSWHRKILTLQRQLKPLDTWPEYSQSKIKAPRIKCRSALKFHRGRTGFFRLYYQKSHLMEVLIYLSVAYNCKTYISIIYN